MDRWNEYQVCKERGHVDSGIQLSSLPPFNVCAKCGTHYRWSQELVEKNIPKADDE